MARPILFSLIGDDTGETAFDAFGDFNEALNAEGSTAIAVIGAGGALVAAGAAALPVVIAINQYLYLLDQVLGIVIKARELGFFEDDQDDLKRIADSLEVVLPDASKTSIAEIVRRATINTEIVEGVPQEESQAQLLKQLIKDLRWTLPDGTIVTAGESFGSLLYAGVVSGYRQIP